MTSKLSSLLALSLLIAHCYAQLSIEDLMEELRVNRNAQPTQSSVRKEVKSGCGWSNNDAFVVADNNLAADKAKFAEIPWMIEILKKRKTGEPFFYYGGSLIAPNVVLTVTSKILSAKVGDLIARGGQWNRRSNNDSLRYIDMAVKEIVLHDGYTGFIGRNDVALLILEQPFPEQNNIRPVCLPEHNANFDNKRCFFTGWGTDPTYQYPSILKKIDVPIVPHDTCLQQLVEAGISPAFKLHESNICAGGEKNKDACIRDEGSPLVCPMPGAKNRYYQVGIFSWSLRCFKKELPGVYSNVPYLRPWIEEKLAARGISIDYFTP